MHFRLSRERLTIFRMLEIHEFQKNEWQVTAKNSKSFSPVMIIVRQVASFNMLLIDTTTYVRSSYIVVIPSGSSSFVCSVDKFFGDVANDFCPL